jgi:hypothetical protein
MILNILLFFRKEGMSINLERILINSNGSFAIVRLFYHSHFYSSNCKSFLKRVGKIWGVAGNLGNLRAG